MALSYKARLDAKLTAIKRALTKINTDPDYGICQECGNTIPVARLIVAPDITLCMPCINESSAG